MRTSARILISLAVVIVVLGALNLWTEWGQKDFSVDADEVGACVFLVVSCLVVGVVLKALSKTGEPPVEAADETPGDEETDDPGTPLCPNCLAPTEPLQHFCAECGSPLTSHAEIDPLGRIYSMGYTFRKAVDSPRRLIVLVGMWCIFALPILLVTIISAALIAQQSEYSFPDDGGLLDWGETSGWSASWAVGGVLSVLLLLLGFVLLYGAIVVKTTKNYFCGDQTTDGEDADATGPGAESPPAVVVATRVLGRILIFIGVSVVVFGVLVLGTRWGVRDYGPDAGEAGEFAVLFGAGVLVLGVVALVGPKNPRRRRGESPRRDPNEKVPVPPRRIVLIASWLLFGGPGAVVIIVMWLTSWHDSKISSESWRLSTILVLVIVTGFIVSIARFLVRWSLGTYRERVRSDLLDPENVKDDA